MDGNIVKQNLESSNGMIISDSYYIKSLDVSRNEVSPELGTSDTRRLEAMGFPKRNVRIVYVVYV